MLCACLTIEPEEKPERNNCDDSGSRREEDTREHLDSPQDEQPEALKL